MNMKSNYNDGQRQRRKYVVNNNYLNIILWLFFLFEEIQIRIHCEMQQTEIFHIHLYTSYIEC